MKKFSPFIILILILLAGWFIWTNFNGQEVDLPKGQSQEITINQNGVDKDILETDGVKHSVPLDEILGGGPGKDGIPSIDNPKFISISEANDFIDDEESGIAVDTDGVRRFYPFQILVYHEIVNDTVNGQRILVSYCPLCLSGVIFDPLVNGERVEFGVSGKLWNSNLVMYDRKTDSLWSQALGEAIVGEITGAILEILPFDQLKYGNWKNKYPNGQVLSRETGATKFYGTDPYGSYYTSPGIYFPVNNEDNRLQEKDMILGVDINGETKAYLPSAIKEASPVEDEVGGVRLLLEYMPDIDTVRISKINDDGTQERINPFPMFWFAWVAVHPDTELYY